jgi:type I restriction enzyme, S subunit
VIRNSDWIVDTIADVCTVGDGAHAKIPRSEDGVMYLMAKNFKAGGIEFSSVEYIAREQFEAHFKDSPRVPTVPHVGDVLVSIIGTLGEPYVVRAGDEFGLSSSVAILRPDLTKVLTQYLYYWLKAPRFQDAVFGIKGGVAQSYLSLGMIKSLPVVLPPLSTQRKIAAILSAYDDLIENNNRRIKLLEEMAQRVYREWFVDFRYPGHEGIPLVDSESGSLPEGWAATTVSGIVKRIPHGRVYQGADIHPSGRVPIIDQSRDEIAGFHDDEPGVVASLDDPAMVFGDHTCKMQVMTEPFSVGPNVVAFRPSVPLPPLFLYQVLSGLVHTQEYKRHWTSLGSKLVVVPPGDIADQYVKSVQSGHVLANTLRYISRNLRTTRDLLLPRLISGEIDITNLNIVISGAVA